eukprot:snap_masked-scaffold_21-processed-gene-0.12-mRNA-1 protein AED:1.00 eAED:1.00 QI:0/0/0/0/1/1/2/0/222
MSWFHKLPRREILRELIIEESEEFLNQDGKSLDMLNIKSIILPDIFSLRYYPITPYCYYICNRDCASITENWEFNCTNDYYFRAVFEFLIQAFFLIYGIFCQCFPNAIGCLDGFCWDDNFEERLPLVRGCFLAIKDGVIYYQPKLNAVSCHKYCAKFDVNSYDGYPKIISYFSWENNEILVNANRNLSKSSKVIRQQPIFSTKEIFHQLIKLREEWEEDNAV